MIPRKGKSTEKSRTRDTRKFWGEPTNDWYAVCYCSALRLWHSDGMCSTWETRSSGNFPASGGEMSLRERDWGFRSVVSGGNCLGCEEGRESACGQCDSD